MSTRAFLGLLGVGGGKDADAATVSENELRLIIGSAKQSGAVEPDEQARLKPPSPLHPSPPPPAQDLLCNFPPRMCYFIM